MRLFCPKCARAQKLLDHAADVSRAGAALDAPPVKCTAAWHRYYDNSATQRPARVPMPIMPAHKPRTVSPTRVVVQPNFPDQRTRRVS